MIIGLGNALADILTNIQNDRILTDLGLQRGSMTLVDRPMHARIEEKLTGQQQTIVAGGSAANTMRGLAKLGINTGFIGKIGHDKVGTFIKESLEKQGVKQHLQFSPSSHTGRCMVMISPDGERTMATHLGAAIEMKTEDIDPTTFEGYKILHIEGYLVQDANLIEGAIIKARKAGLKVSLDMASYNIVAENIEFLRRLITQYVDIVFANEQEAETFTGKPAREAVEELSNMCDIAIVKIGEEGSYIKAKDSKIIHVEAIESKAVDTTGAGDLYATGFLYGVSHDLPLERCGEIGSIVAGEVIRHIGPAIPEQEWEKIVAQIKK